MNQSKTSLLTPIYIKPRADTAWPEDSVFYMLTGSGLFLCRNNQFYQSAVPAPRSPVELAKQKSFLAVRYPKVSRRLMEYIVGYFDCVADTHGTEAAVLLAFNKTTGRVQIVVPDQVATVTRNGWGTVFPVGVEYEIPANLSPELALIGDVHSHVDSAAYASYIDKHDETYRPGLHIVVGRLNREPPEFHIEAVTDGARFTVKSEMVLGGYRQRRTDIPEAWMEKITVQTWSQRHYGKKKDDDAHKKEKHPLNKNDGYGDYSPHDADAPAGANGNGQDDKHEPVYETGFDGGEDSGDAPHRDTVCQVRQTTGCDARDEALVEVTINQEILDNLEEGESGLEVEAEHDVKPETETQWDLAPDQTPKLGYEKSPQTKSDDDVQVQAETGSKGRPQAGAKVESEAGPEADSAQQPQPQNQDEEDDDERA